MTAQDWAAALVIVLLAAGIAAMLSNVFGTVPYDASADDDPYRDDDAHADAGADATDRERDDEDGRD